MLATAHRGASILVWNIKSRALVQEMGATPFAEETPVKRSIDEPAGVAADDRDRYG